MSGTKMSSVMVEDEKVKVGDFLGFKYDYEMTGRVVSITRQFGRVEIGIRVNAGDEGDQVHYETPDRCWLEG